MSSPDVRHRAATEDDLPAAVDLFFQSVDDMTARHGLPPAAGRDAVLDAYRHVLDTGIFQLAESGGELVAIAHAVVRGEQWFLSGFWARPGRARQGIGGPLLRRVKELGAADGATLFFTWSSVDMAAIGAYLRAGMLPGVELLTFAGVPEAIPPVPALWRTEPLTVEAAAALDRVLRGTGREVDHRYFLSRKSGSALLRDGAVVGYYYLENGLVGPAGWLVPADAEALLHLALAGAVVQSGQVRVTLPGCNHAGLRVVLERRLRLVSNAHLLTSAPFGAMERYVPSGPSLF